MAKGNRTFEEGVKEELLERLASGEFLTSIARDERMPDVSTIKRWASAGDAYADQIRLAREAGFEVETERLIDDVRNCDDAQKARVLSEAIRWRIGKLSQVFRDRPLVGVAVNVGDSDAFAAFSGALEAAHSARAGLAHSTQPVALPSPSGSTHPGGGLADMASAGGERLGEDPHGG